MSRPLAAQLSELVNQISTIIVGKRPQIEDCVACLLAGGHLLIEDVPGVGKTTLAHAIAVSLGLKFSRTQFTADLMPSDLIGVSVYERTQASPSSSIPARCSPTSCSPTRSTAPARRRRARCSRRWKSTRSRSKARRAPCRRRSSSSRRRTRPTSSAPIPLPESQLDRFLMCITLGYPDRKSERELLAGGDRREAIGRLAHVMTPAELVAAQAARCRPCTRPTRCSTTCNR